MGPPRSARQRVLNVRGQLVARADLPQTDDTIHLIQMYAIRAVPIMPVQQKQFLRSLLLQYRRLSSSKLKCVICY